MIWTVCTSSEHSITSPRIVQSVEKRGEKIYNVLKEYCKNSVSGFETRWTLIILSSTSVLALDSRRADVTAWFGRQLPILKGSSEADLGSSRRLICTSFHKAVGGLKMVTF